MKTRKFEKILSDFGFVLSRTGDHRVWVKAGTHVPVPSGRDINRMVARRILKEIGYQGRVDELNYG